MLMTHKCDASSDNCPDRVDKINLGVEHIRKWMLHNELQIHPSKCKHSLCLLDLPITLRIKYL